MNIAQFRELLKIYTIKDSNLIRIGKNSDGGYVLPDSLIQDADVLYGTVKSFMKR